jgi:aminoglycoside phosphotransferase (APT) family kinase protein
MHAETPEVRSGEQVNWSALATYLRWHLTDNELPGLRLDDEMQVTQFPGGHSNRTYLIRLGGAELVLRRAPPGPLAPKAHDVAREYQWLAALHPVFPLAPRPYLLCEDESVVGSVFCLMERRRGIVVRTDEPMTLAGHPAARRRLSEAVVDTLADLHGLDISHGPLAERGKPAGFLDRLVRDWTKRWEQSRLEPVPDMDRVALWLTAHQPAETLDPTVVHGDFTLHNLLLNPLDPAEVVAVLDWEMTALGDPLVDLGILLAHWAPTDEGDGHGDAGALSTVTGRDGYLSRGELIARYASRTDRDVTDIGFYEAFALFTIAVVSQQNSMRDQCGQTDDPQLAGLGNRVPALARRAWTLAQ